MKCGRAPGHFVQLLYCTIATVQYIFLACFLLFPNTPIPLFAELSTMVLPILVLDGGTGRSLPHVAQFAVLVTDSPLLLLPISHSMLDCSFQPRTANSHESFMTYTTCYILHCDIVCVGRCKHSLLPRKVRSTFLQPSISHNIPVISLVSLLLQKRNT